MAKVIITITDESPSSEGGNVRVACVVEPKDGPDTPALGMGEAIMRSMQAYSDAVSKGLGPVETPDGRRFANLEALQKVAKGRKRRIGR